MACHELCMQQVARPSVLPSVRCRTFVADPEISALKATAITQTSVTLMWSIGDTTQVDSIRVHHREAGSSAAGDWQTTSSNSLFTVNSLRPDTTYEFYVEIRSNNKTARTSTLTVTTGALMPIGYHQCSAISPRSTAHCATVLVDFAEL